MLDRKVERNILEKKSRINRKRKKKKNDKILQEQKNEGRIYYKK